MTLDELRNLITQLQTAPADITDEQLTAARELIQSQRDELAAAAPTAETVALLTELRDARLAVIGVQEQRAADAERTAAEVAELLAGLDENTAAENTDGDSGQGDAPADAAAEQPVADAPAEQTPELAVAAAAMNPAAFVAAVAAAVREVVRRDEPQPVTASGDQPAPQGRSAGRLGTQTPAQTAPRDAVTVQVHASGSSAAFQHGTEIGSSAELGRLVSDRVRSTYTGDRGSDGQRVHIARITSQYPETRVLSANDFDGNHSRIEAVTAPRALVAAGGLCAPLEVLYDVEVVGSTDRPVRDALARFAVDRGGIQFRPNTSAAAAVHGAGVWTMANDTADPIGSKGCYVVDCPGVQSATVQAIYTCLEFANITARFDPETTASNVQQGMIAHTRLAENQLLAALATGSKILSAAKVVGATRDILANLDKAVAYYRNRHRINDAVNLTFILPGWVKSLMRADIARQMAAGDWALALGIADAQINQWFSTRGVTPVWHLDGPTGLDEVQTVTISGSPTGGTFTLTYSGQTTGAIAYNATAATVQAALVALSNVAADEVVVTGSAGGPWTVTFSGGTLHGANVAQMTATSSLTGGSSPSVAVATSTGGGGALTVSGISIASQTYPDAAAGAALPGFPDQIDSLLFASGSWLFLDGGSLDLGLVRDSTLNDRNRYRQFSESFEGTAFRGVESLRLVMSVQPTGQASGTADASGFND